MSGSIAGLPPIPMYLEYSANEASYAAQSAQAQPQTEALANYFSQNAASINSPTALLSDYKALQVVLGAFNMSADANDTAVLQQLMTQNPNDPSSLAAKSANPTWQRFAQFLSNWSPSPFADPANIATMTQSYLRNQFETASGQQIPGMQQALYFTRAIGSVTSINGLLADQSLLPVVLNAVGLPSDAFGALDYTQQVNILTPLVNFSNFTNPSWVQNAAEQYLVAQQEQSIGQGPAAGSLLAAFDPTSSASDDANALLGLLSAPSASSTGTQAALLSLFA